MAERNYFSNARRGRTFLKRLLLTLLVLAVVGGLVAAGLAVFSDDTSEPPLPTAEVDHFLTAWTRADGPGMAAFLDNPPRDLLKTATSLIQSSPGAKASYTRTAVTRVGTNASATYHARIELPGLGHVEWDATLTVLRLRIGQRDAWRIQWQPADLYPGLKNGQKLALRRVWPVRASIFAGDGSQLAGSGVVTIGLEPDRIGPGLDKTKQLMQTLVGTKPAAIDAALHAPGVRPNSFVAIATVPDDARYRDVLRPQLAPLPGLFFRRSAEPGGAGGELAASIVGRVGEVTADRLKQLGSPYRVGDQVGLTGLQATYEHRLAGTPSADVVLEAGADVVRTIKHFPGKAGENVRLSLDPRIQQAGEAALAGVLQPAALVAIDAPTGKLLAIVSKPDGGFPRALEGGYPPGSTFKVITSEALLAAGRTGTTAAPCPPELRVFGRVFKNFEGESAGALDLANAFKISCNNSFIALADQLPSDALASAAALFGFNAKYSLGVTSRGGSLPKAKDRAELAATAIGQGRVLASPMHMASVAAAVAAGQWHAPMLTTEPAPRVPKVAPIAPGVLATLRSFMASVVQPGGTAAGAGFPAGVAGKTGTAEFGTGSPPPTHAWFIGYRGNLAFAVVVEGGGVGGRVAAPLAAKFVSAVP